MISVSGGPAASDGFPTIRSLATFPGPILLIASEDDWAFPKGTSAAIATAHQGNDTLLVVPGNGHALALIWGHPPEEGQVYAAIDSYLAQMLPK